MSDVTVTVQLSTRPMLKRIARLPSLFRKNYRSFRRAGESLIISAYGAWLMSRVVVRVKR